MPSASPNTPQARIAQAKARIANLDAQHAAGELDDAGWQALRRPFERHLMEALADDVPPSQLPRTPPWLPRALQLAVFAVLGTAAWWAWQQRGTKPSRWAEEARVVAERRGAAAASAAASRAAEGPVIIYAPPLPRVAPPPAGASR